MSATGPQDGLPQPICQLTTWPAHGLQSAIWVLGLSLLLLVPAIRTAEVNDSGVAKEQVEEFTQTARFRSEKRRLHKSFDIAVVAPQPALASFEFRNLTFPVSQQGHRLPNGLLAPIRC
jgi:hypothetical protein